MSANKRLVAMISSTARDLPEHRKQVLDACLRMGVFPVMMEQQLANDEDAISESLRLVNEADIYICILGFRYGYVPDGYDKSITELEYARAVERGIPRLVFLMGEDHPVKASSIEMGAGAAKLAEFKSHLKKDRVVGFFNSIDELRAQVIQSLASIRQQQAAESQQVSELKQSKQREVIRVFVASPRDVQEERLRMPKVIESLNKTLGKLLNIVIELWRWEVDAPPAVGEPQALIDPELDEADVVVVIFWNRFGLTTQTGTTGTEGEVLRSLERWNKMGRPQVMMYFCQRPARLDREELEQGAKVLDFRERVSSLVLAVDYEGVSDFEWRVRDDLFTTIARARTSRR
jgi:hypothetical protein